MKILIANMNDVGLRTFFDEPYIHISIRSNHGMHKPFLFPDDNRVDTLFMVFDDCSLEEAEYVNELIIESPEEYEPAMQLFPMTLEQAHEIWDFVEKYYPKEVRAVLFQCEAGISRSSGVAAGILTGLFLDDSRIYNDRRYHPNSHVKNMLLQARRERLGQIEIRE